MYRHSARIDTRQYTSARLLAGYVAILVPEVFRITTPPVNYIRIVHRKTSGLEVLQRRRSEHDVGAFREVDETDFQGLER